MTKSNFLPIVLAAGRGTRMGTKKPKVMHEVGGLPLIHHIYHTLKGCTTIPPCLVTAPDMQSVREQSAFQTHIIQDQPKGTGHAVLSAEAIIKESQSDVLVLCGDTPLIEVSTVEAIVNAATHYDVVIAGSYVDHPNSYGRLLLNDQGCVSEIVEAHECDDDMLSEETLCNAGIMYIKSTHVLSLLHAIDNKNQKKEYYLTQIVSIANSMGLTVGVVEATHEEIFGVNTQHDLAMAEFLFQQKKRAYFLGKGVSMVDPESVYFSHDTEIGADTTLEPNVFIGCGVSTGEGVTIKAFCHMEGTTLRPGSAVGPFARLRPGTDIGENAKVGNFVEIKKSTLGTGSKVSHLSYIGDTKMGHQVNIGAGTITCNYDGRHKHSTTIEDDTFVGSNTAIIAPVSVGPGALIGAGSVITQDVQAGDLALSRSPQKIFPGKASAFLGVQKKK